MNPQFYKRSAQDSLCLLWVMLLLAAFGLDAQVVPDGATATLANVTNTFTGTVTIGTNGSFTLLTLADNALVTNSTGGVIGANATAKSNEVRLVSPTARWKMGGTLMVGSGGERNQLVVSNGGLVTANRGSVGDSSGHNQAVVSGAGSVWSNALSFVAGFSGQSNRVVVNGGGLLNNGVGVIGDSADGNEVTVTGPGSLWENRRDLTVGSLGVGNRLLVSDGGRVLSSNAFVGLQSPGNLAMVSGAGSVWSNRFELTVGHSSGGNQLAVTNGGLVASSNGYIGRAFGALGNMAFVSGPGSLWTNSADLFIGSLASGARLEVRAGGAVSTGRGLLGATNGTLNTLVVADSGSRFLASTELTIGHGGPQNSLVITNGARVASSNALLGFQTSASNNSAIVTGLGSVWSNRNLLIVGSNSPGNRVEVRDGGSVFLNGSISVARSAQSVSNSVLVTGPGSVWSNAPGSAFELGFLGSGNRLVASNGGRMELSAALLGQTSTSEGNEAVLTGPDTVVDASFLILGNSGPRNRLRVGNGASLRSSESSLGFSDTSRSNDALVADPGSLWTSDRLVVGFSGSGSQLILTNGGTFLCPHIDNPDDREEHALVVGETRSSTNNRVVVNGGVLQAANGNGTATLDVRRGTNALNAGLIDVDVLLLTNNLGRFEFNGGTLITRGADIRNNAVFTIGNAGSFPAVWEVQPGVSNHFVADSVVVGSLVPFCQLIHTNGALLTNDGAGVLGQDAASRSNSATLAGPASRWWLGDGVVVGEGGSGNRLVVRDGASLVTASISYLGLGAASTNNEAVVTGPGSSWFTANFGLRVGDEGRNNRLLVSDGGVVSSFDDVIGNDFSSSNNQVLVTGSGSLWNNTRELTVGLNGIGNQLVVSNGGTVFTIANKYVGQNDGALSNTVIVTGPGSAWLGDDSLRVGADGSFNRLFVRNGGRVTSGIANLGENFGADGNQALITDAGSVWSNRFELNVGGGGSANQLVISNSGAIVSARDGLISRDTGARSNSVILTDVGTRWLIASNLYVGSNGALGRLVISNGARVENRSGSLGTGLSSSNNLAVVTGAGSVWSNQFLFRVGESGAGNRLVITNGGRVEVNQGQLGLNTSSSNNDVVVTGTGSFWRMEQALVVGYSGSESRLQVTDGGRVRDAAGYIGYQAGINDEVLVTGAGSSWSNSSLSVGHLGSRSRLVISNSGEVFASSGVTVGLGTQSTNNRVVVQGGTLRVTNASATGALDVRRGTNVLNGGVVETDLLLLTNTLGSFEFNGGTLITRGAAISNGQSFIVGRTGATPAIWDVRAGPNPQVISGFFVIGEAAPFCQLLVTNGALLNGVEGVIGNASGSDSSQAIVSGPGSRLDVLGDLFVGNSASFNSLVISNGAWVNTGFPVIGAELGSINNQAVVTGSNSLWTSHELVIGFGGAANRALVTDGGTVTVINSAIMGVLPATSSNNLFHVANGALFVTNGAATGTLNIRSGTNRLDAGLVDVDRLVITNGRGEFEFNGGTLATRATVIGHGRIFTVGNGLAEATLELRGGTHAFLGGLVIANHASLTGNGAAPGALTVQAGGTLAPGASIGALAFSIAPILQGATVMEIRKTGATLTNDLIHMAGTLAYGGLLTVTNLGPDVLSAGNRFRLFVASGYSGSFSLLVLPPLAPGLTWRNDLAVDGSITVVGIPSPGFSAISLSGTNLILAGTNGPPNANYAVLAATNVALPLSNWVSIATNQFDSSGGFSFTNAIDPDFPQRFFQLFVP